MKKLKLIFAVLFLAAAVVSCNMVEWNEINSLGVPPTLINKAPKIYPGGNAECSTINIPGLVKTSGRNNFFSSTDSFENGWPSGLLVKVDEDKSVSFQIEGSINFGDGKCYKVGAVIVKGSDASNVYDYTDIGGVTMDRGLVSPNNSSGGPAGLSNLTFCFVECKPIEPVVIALKAFYSPGPNYVTPIKYSFLLSTGESIFSILPCSKLGINYYPNISAFAVKDYYYGETVGTVTIKEDINSLVVKVTLNEGGLLDKTYLFVGTKEEILNSVVDGCPDYSNNSIWHFDDNNAQEVTFIIPN
jgi:hypothetical protein